MNISRNGLVVRRAVAVLTVAAVGLLLPACTSSDDSAKSSGSSSATTTDGPAPIGSGSQTPPPTETPPAPETTPQPSVSVDANTPVPKAGREGQTAAPTISADPVAPNQPVVYPDKVSLGIDSVTFGVESDKGPGAFPGREYAVITFSVANGSGSAINLDTAIVTVLDSTNNPVPQIFPSGLQIADLHGTLNPGTTTTATYAFAVPASSRSQVTVVVDFDAVHTSAVFRGPIG